ncbi:uracil-DNA glycosylase family protein [Amedibacillus sp. YH-ame10]
MQIKQELSTLLTSDMSVPTLTLDPTNIHAIMINEVVPMDPRQDFYGEIGDEYLSTTIPLFQNAGAHVETIEDILDLGIYITNAIKIPKLTTTVSKQDIERSLPILEKELSLFPNVKVIMLMGDVAKKAYNTITKNQSKKAVIPSISTYKLRDTSFYYKDIRIIPSYIMTGKNILIEKSKVQMASEDIAKMLDIIS